MNNIIDVVFELSKKLNENIEEIDYEDMLVLVEKREELVEFLNQNLDLTVEMKYKLHTIGQFDSIFVAKMKFFQTQARMELDRLAQGKIQQKGYNPVYSADSYFYDERK